MFFEGTRRTQIKVCVISGERGETGFSGGPGVKGYTGDPGYYGNKGAKGFRGWRSLNMYRFLINFLEIN